jgi:hypothetical protein
MQKQHCNDNCKQKIACKLLHILFYVSIPVVRDKTKYVLTLCPLVSVQIQPVIIQYQNPCDCDYFKSTTMSKASPELSAKFWVTALGSTHFTARKLAGEQLSNLTSVIRGRPYAESTMLVQRGRWWWPGHCEYGV